ANAGSCTYGDAFEDYRVCAGDADGPDDDWFRVPTEFDGTTLRFSYEGDCTNVRFAYYPPYTRARRIDLATRLKKSGRAKIEDVGKTARGETMQTFAFGREDDDAKKL